MWRKIHSNRDPRDTVYSELQKEFSPYFKKANDAGKSVLQRNPKFAFYAMILVMLVSMVLSFTVFRFHEAERPPIKKQQINPVQDGFAQIRQVTGKIRETLRLKHLVDSISAKKQLSPADSTALDSALNELQRIKNIK